MGPTTAAPQRSRVGGGTFTLADVATANGAGLAQDIYLVTFVVSGSGTGTVDATVNWTFASNDIDIGIFRGDCLAGACDLLAASETLSKPETVRASVTSGTHTLAILNYGPGSESGTYEIFLTS
jgi:hypothetical protein